MKIWVFCDVTLCQWVFPSVLKENRALNFTSQLPDPWTTNLPNYKYRQYTVEHNSISDFSKVYFLHCFIRRHVLAPVMSHLQVDYFSY